MRLGYNTMNTPEDVRPDVLARALEDPAHGWRRYWYR